MKHSQLFTATFLLCIATCLTAPIWFSSQLTAKSVSPLAGELKPVDVNMHDFMEGVFQAPYKRLKIAMAQSPADNAAWKSIRSDALILAEGGNLLLTRLPSENQADWVSHSEKSRDAGGEFVAAANAAKLI